MNRLYSLTTCPIYASITSRYKPCRGFGPWSHGTTLSMTILTKFWFSDNVSVRTIIEDLDHGAMKQLFLWLFWPRFGLVIMFRLNSCRKLDHEAMNRLFILAFRINCWLHGVLDQPKIEMAMKLWIGSSTLNWAWTKRPCIHSHSFTGRSSNMQTSTYWETTQFS